MAYSMFSTPVHQLRLKSAMGGIQSQYGAEAMTTVNTHPTPKMGTLTLGTTPAHFPAPIERAQTICEALGAALYWLDSPNEQRALLATAHARRALTLLKKACTELATAGRAA
jgi:hypothetical protein